MHKNLEKVACLQIGITWLKSYWKMEAQLSRSALSWQVKVKKLREGQLYHTMLERNTTKARENAASKFQKKRGRKPN